MHYDRQIKIRQYFTIEFILVYMFDDTVPDHQILFRQYFYFGNSGLNRQLFYKMSNISGYTVLPMLHSHMQLQIPYPPNFRAQKFVIMRKCIFAKVITQLHNYNGVTDLTELNETIHAN